MESPGNRKVPLSHDNILPLRADPEVFQTDVQLLLTTAVLIYNLETSYHRLDVGTALGVILNIQPLHISVGIGGAFQFTVAPFKTQGFIVGFRPCPIGRFHREDAIDDTVRFAAAAVTD